MTIIVHDHGAPDTIVTIVEDPVVLVAVVEAATPPPRTVKEAASFVDLADVVDKKKKSP